MYNEGMSFKINQASEFKKELAKLDIEKEATRYFEHTMRLTEIGYVS